MSYTKLKNFRHADPQKVCIVWQALESLRGQKQAIPSEKLVKVLRKKLSVKDDQIRLLLSEIEGDGLIVKTPTPTKGGSGGFKLPDFRTPCHRQHHDWYCFRCHRPGETLQCSDCFRVFHPDCVNESLGKSSPNTKGLRSPFRIEDDLSEFVCPVCESRPKCEFSRKQIRKLLEFATHNLRKQPLWKDFCQIGFKGNIDRNEYLVYKYVDLDLLQRKIKDGRYTALEYFAMDVELLVHDICILSGPYSNDADEARFLLRSVNTEISEIQLCTDCYINAKARLSDWITKPCKPPHELLCARNRTSAGAGLFDNTNILQCFWPAKILLERDDAYEIRFFGGTHERMLVKKSNTLPFVFPEDDPSFLRKSQAGVHSLPSGVFERAWNEVRKLQANLDSGYYSHSSGESDMPSSDDEYSDDVYLRSRRNSANNLNTIGHLDSPRSSLTSFSNKVDKRMRHSSSSSQQTVTSTATPRHGGRSPANSSLGRQSKHLDVIKPLPKTSSALSRKYQHATGSGGAGDTSPLSLATARSASVFSSSFGGESKAALSATAAGRKRNSSGRYADIFSSTTDSTDSPTTAHKKLAKQSPGSGTASVPGKTFISSAVGSSNVSKVVKTVSCLKNKKMPAKRMRRPGSGRDISPTSLSSLSSTSSDSDSLQRKRSVSSHNTSDSSDELTKPSAAVWPSRGRRPSQRGSSAKTRTPNGSVSQRQLLKGKTLTNSAPLRGGVITTVATFPGRRRGRPPLTSRATTRGRSRVTVNHKISPLNDFDDNDEGERASHEDNDDDDDDDDDELTDRCSSSALGTGGTGADDEVAVFPARRKAVRTSPAYVRNPAIAATRGRNGNSTRKTDASRTHRRGHHSSGGLDTSSSSSTSSDESFGSFPTSKRISSDLKSPVGTPGATMLRRPPFAPPPPPPPSSTPSQLSNSIAFGSNSTTTSGQAGSMRPFTALEMAADPKTTCGGNESLARQVSVMSSLNNHTMTSSLITGTGSSVSSVPRSHLPPNKRVAAAAAAAALSGGVASGLGTAVGTGNQTTGSRKLSHKAIQTPTSGDSQAQLPCSRCKEQATELATVNSENRRALVELEETLTRRFNEEKVAAVELAQSTLQQTLERERALARETLESAEARFNDAIVQTKRRQWCRNCLKEAMYHCCWNTSYCSISCQQEHWQKEHKRQCRRKR